MDVEQATNGITADVDNSGAAEVKKDGLLTNDQQEMCERVAHLEKRVREHEDEIVCLKGALADVVRRLGQVEIAKSQANSILPSKPMVKGPRRLPPAGQERPRSAHIEHSRTSLAPARQTPRGQSATSAKKWSSTSNADGTNGVPSSPRHGSQSSPLSHAKRSASIGSLTRKSTNDRYIFKGFKDPVWNEDDKYLRMYLKGRPVPLYAPDDVCDFDVKAPQDPPDRQLQLEWVYGYRGRDSRSNLYLLPTGEVLYFAAEVVVLYNVNEGTQRFYLEHTDDVKCIAIHPDQVKIASGQVAGHEKKEGKPHVRVWDSVDLHTYYVIGEGDFQRGVCCIAFSKLDGGRQLLAVDEGNDHNMSVWDVSKDNKCHKITEMKSSGDPVTQCDFHPYEENLIICCGKSQITFWTLDKHSLNKKAGIFEKNEKPKVVICFTFAENGDVVSGDSSGNIYIWGKDSRGTWKVTQAVPGAHDGPVFTLCSTKDGFILSGGKDRRVTQWDSNYSKTGLEAQIPEDYGGVRMVSQGQGNMLLVGTIRNAVLQGNFDLGFTPVIEGHMDELWGLDAHPRQLQFLTCGADRHVYLWDSLSHRSVWCKEIHDPAHCCSIHPSLDVAAIGLTTGKWLVLDLNTHEIGAVYTDGAEQHECIQYSPDGSMLAVGNRDNYIYLYEVSEDGHKYHKMGRCYGHSSYVTHVDWSADSRYLRSNSGDYEVLYWVAATHKQETSKDEIRNLDWATQNCTLSWNSIGVWPDGADGTDVNNCGKSNDNTLIVSADDFGKVNLLEYPSVQPRATGHAYGGHSSHVTNAVFLNDDKRVITTGGRDMTVLQWQVL